MQTAVISYIDDNVKDNFENDFLKTLRKNARYKGAIYLIYYGFDKKFSKRIKEKYGVVVVYKRKTISPQNQRNKNLSELIRSLPVEIKNVMCVDGGDVWFQSSIDQVFALTEKGYGFVEEDLMPADSGFNLNSIKQIKNKKFKRAFLSKVMGKIMINSGMIVGEKRAVYVILKQISILTLKTKQDFFGLDQAIFNYVIRKNKKGISLPQTYNYPLSIKRNKYFVENKLFYDENKELIKIVHNLGGINRTLPNGRKSLIPISPKPENLPGSFWGVTVFFNPAKYKNKIKNYRKFRERNKKQGLKLLVVELAFDKNRFELKKEDADILIQLRTDCVMWHKERLINIGIENLPEDCDKFAWLDADIIFDNDNWIEDTCKALQTYPIVQPFSFCIRLPKNVFKISKPNIEQMKFTQRLDEENKKVYGIGCRVSQLGKDVLMRSAEFYGHVGFAWAARRNIFNEVGILDKSAFPNLDFIMAHLFYNNELNWECEKFINSFMKESFLEWSEKIKDKVGGSVYYTPGMIFHLWHGKLANRNYKNAIAIIQEENFNPKTDIEIAENGCYVWTSDKPQLQKRIKEYFLARNEDGITKRILFSDYRDFLKIFRAQILDFIKKIPEKIDRMLGIMGIFLRMISPRLYFFTKKIERKIRKSAF
jgi:hypothetical protein